MDLTGYRNPRIIWILCVAFSIKLSTFIIGILKLIWKLDNTVQANIYALLRLCKRYKHAQEKEQLNMVNLLSLGKE